MKSIVLAGVMAVWAAPAFAADWSVDMEESRLGFAGTQDGDKPFTGEFEEFTADITFDPDALDNASARVEVDLTSAKTGDRQRDSFIAMPVWLDAKGQPTAVFEATEFRRLEDGQYAADGTLTLKDVSRPVTLPFTLDIEGDTATAHGVVTLDRNDFNIGGEEYADDKYVGIDVDVIVDLVATRKAP